MRRRTDKKRRRMLKQLAVMRQQFKAFQAELHDLQARYRDRVRYAVESSTLDRVTIELHRTTRMIDILYDRRELAFYLDKHIRHRVLIDSILRVPSWRHGYRACAEQMMRVRDHAGLDALNHVVRNIADEFAVGLFDAVLKTLPERF